MTTPEKAAEKASSRSTSRRVAVAIPHPRVAWPSRSSAISSVAPEDGDDDLSLGVSGSEIPERLGSLAQLILPVDHRCHRSGLEQLLQDDQIFLLDLRQKRSHHPAAPAQRTET